MIMMMIVVVHGKGGGGGSGQQLLCLSIYKAYTIVNRFAIHSVCINECQIQYCLLFKFN